LRCKAQQRDTAQPKAFMSKASVLMLLFGTLRGGVLMPAPKV
jgi:hypothetical protein